MPSTSQLAAFAVASFLFIQVPGPSLLFTIGRALTVGRRDALLSVVGNALGLVAQVVLVAVGLGAVVAASATAFTVLKLAGAAYVAYLGIQAIRHRGDARAALAAADEGADVSRPSSSLASVRTGFLVGATNPKTIVFFVAFLPQFIDDGPLPRRSCSSSASCSARWRCAPTPAGRWSPAGRATGSPASRSASTAWGRPAA